jgi:hypothetical protein
VQYLKQSTAATVTTGPFLDKGDGVTPETGLAAGTVDEIGVYKHDATALTDISGTTTFTHRAGGMYTTTLSTGDTGTLGRMRLYVRDDSVCLPVWEEFTVLAANIYDSLIGGGDNLQVDATQVEGSDATDQINAACDAAIETYGLDHLVSAAVVGADVTDDSIIAQLVSTSGTADWDTFDNATDSLQSIRDNHPTNFADLSVTVTTGRVDVASIEGVDATDQINAACDTALSDVNLDHLVGTAAPGIAPAGTYLDILADDGTATYDRTTDSLQALRDRGDAAWTTGGGGSITDILNVIPLIPEAIDLANTASWRLGLMLHNALDDLPSTAEITPGTIDIDRKAIGGTSWSSIVSGAACSEIAGLVYYDEVFDSGTGYAAGDSIRIIFKSQKITVAANDYEIIGATGRIFYTSIREAERGTDSALLAASAPTNFGDLSITASTGRVDVASVEGSDATDQINAACDTALSDVNLDHLVGTAAPGIAPAGTYLDILADDGTATYDRTTDSLQALRDRGDAAWITGGGGAISDILNIQPLMPESIDLANTAAWRLGIMLINSVDDLPSTAEITPGTIDIDRKAIGGTSWSSVVSGGACLELAGLIYYDEVFDSGTGYAEGDSIRVTFKSQKITVAANDYEISDANGRIFYTEIRQTETGATAVADAVWDEDIVAAHNTADTAGWFLDNLDQVLSTTETNIRGADSDDLKDISDEVAALSIPTAAAVADAVLEELISDHSGVAGSLAATIANMPDSVWDEVMEAGAPAAAQTARQWMRLFAATLLNVTGSTGDWSAKSLDGTKVRISGTLDGAGTRTAVGTMDGT